LNKIEFNKFQNDKKFTPNKVNFYSNKSLNKICELNIASFNTEDCKYTTLKRSTLINFLKKDLEDLIKTNYNISKIDKQNNLIRLSFENNETNEFDYLIISDGVFSKCRNLISKNPTTPKYNNTLAIRGVLPASLKNIDNKNISLFLGSDSHYVVYPTSLSGDLNFIAIMKYKLSVDDQRNYLLFKDNSFIKKVLKKILSKNENFIDNLKQLKIFPVFISDDFYKVQNKNIHLIGDAFFAFPPSFAQGASQSIEGAYELFQSIENKTENDFFKSRVNKTKMINVRSKFNQFAFHLSNPLTIFLRHIFL
jgi:salicylate hydroxylase